MFPPHPQFSFSTPQNCTFHGFSCPFFLRRSAIGLTPSKFRYSTHFDISSGVPLPRFPHMYGSVPRSSHRSKNSWVPKLLSSTTPPQCVLIIFGLFARSPIPSLQWYSSAKHPPGQRRFGILILRSASTISVRILRVLVIVEFSSTKNPP